MALLVSDAVLLAISMFLKTTQQRSVDLRFTSFDHATHNKSVPLLCSMVHKFCFLVVKSMLQCFVVVVYNWIIDYLLHVVQQVNYSCVRIVLISLNYFEVMTQSKNSLDK